MHTFPEILDMSRVLPTPAGAPRIIVHDDRPVEEGASERCDLRLSPADKALYLKLGGTAWVRRQLAAARKSSK